MTAAMDSAALPIEEKAAAMAPIASVATAITVLKALPADGTHVGVNELARRLGLHKSKVSRLLSTLALHDFVDRDAQTGKVALGFGAIALAGPLLGRLDVLKVARPVLDAIASETGETSFIALWTGREAVMAEQTIGTRAVVHYSWPGKSVPAHSTAAGKVFLAYLPEAAVRSVLESRFERLTPKTITTRAALQSELAEVRRRGFGINDEEYERESCGVAAPVRDFRGEVVAALTLAIPKHRFVEQLGTVPDAVRRAAHEVSRGLGWTADRAKD